jgi:LPXTG-site transpeptidase (sortase) family protein
MRPTTLFTPSFKKRVWLLCLAFWVGLLGAVPPAVVQAARPAAPLSEGNLLYVNTISDEISAVDCSGKPSTGQCSVRGAISLANRMPGAVTIYLPAGRYSLFGEPGEDKNLGGDLDIDKSGGSITLIGEGETTILDTRQADRILDVLDNGAPTRLNLKNLSLVNGSAGAMRDGGSIRTYGSLALDGVTIQNSSGRRGGAIYLHSAYDQVLLINNSSISYASASLDGGAIYATAEMTSISNSTLDHNTATGMMGVYFKNEDAGRGGAIYNDNLLNITASTLVYNTARQEGGGIFNYAFMGKTASAVINNTTFFANSTAISNVAVAKGKSATSAITTLSNSILAGSTDSENCINDHDENGVTAFVNAGSNLDSGVQCGFGDKSGSLSGRDPRLGEFGDYGGPTNTLPLLDDSPAINQGNPANCTMRDQRGLYAEGRCDSGAFEAGAAPVLLAAVSGSPAAQRLQVTVQNQIGNPLAGWRVSFDVPEWGSLSSPTALTNSLGQAAVTVDLSQLASGSIQISARSGSGAVFFRGSAAGLAPYYRHGLPNTGFAPLIYTALPQHPASLAYHPQPDLQLHIPRLALSLPVVGIPKTGGGWDVSWLAQQAGYLEGTAFPSFAGNSVLTSHVTLADGTPGPFARLDSLAWGDLIQIQAYGTTFTYEVRSVRSVSPGDTSVIAHKDQAWLTLLTCQDYEPTAQTYLRRLAVSAVLVRTSTP